MPPPSENHFYMVYHPNLDEPVLGEYDTYAEAVEVAESASREFIGTTFYILKTTAALRVPKDVAVSEVPLEDLEVE